MNRRSGSSQDAARQVGQVDPSASFRESLLRLFVDIAYERKSRNPFRHFVRNIEAKTPGSRVQILIAHQAPILGASGPLTPCREGLTCPLRSSTNAVAAIACIACTSDGIVRLVKVIPGEGKLVLEVPSSGSETFIEELDQAGGPFAAAIALSDIGLPVRLQESGDRTRALIRELHDSVAQQLGFTSFLVTRLQREAGDFDMTKTLVSEIRTRVTRLQRDVRQLITGAALTGEGQSWRQSLTDAVDEFSRRCNVVFELDNRVPEIKLSPEAALHTLQIVREALSNIVRHAHAQHAWIELVSVPAGRLRVTVTDDGQGLRPPSNDENHYGLEIMRERARAIGAQFEIESLKPSGTQVRLLVPITDATEETRNAAADATTD